MVQQPTYEDVYDEAADNHRAQLNNMEGDRGFLHHVGAYGGQDEH